MRPQPLLLLGLSGFSAAGRFAVDDSCRPDDEFFNSLMGGVHEGLHLAENALEVMTNHAGDQWVQKMAKYVLGTENYEAKFNAVKDTFSKVTRYEKEPSEHRPFSNDLDDEGAKKPNTDWLKARTNMDLELYCGDGRFEKNNVGEVDLDGDSSEYWKDRSTGKMFGGISFPPLKKCYADDFVVGSGEQVAKATTMRSDYINLSAYKAAKKQNPHVPQSNFATPKLHTANTMDICPWFTRWARDQGWPIVDAERVEQWKTAEFTDTLRHGMTPIDGLKTFGVTMLHELTHTNQGGPLVDVNGNDSSGWRNVGALRSERNADSVAMLGMAMKLWKLKHYVEDDGTLHSFQ